MWSLLGSLISSFLLLRDLFGYAIPGAVLVAIATYPELSDPNRLQLPLANEPTWFKLIVAVTGAYVIGQVLATIGYTLYTNKKVQSLLNWITVRYNGQIPAQPDPTMDVDALYFRYLYPSIFLEVDRRDTLTILRVALSIAFVLSACLPNVVVLLRIAFLLIGLFMFWNGYMSRGIAANYRKATVEAARKAETNKIAIFRWSGGDESVD
jgi:hypothetical protein